jgi:hypothetical protein
MIPERPKRLTVTLQAGKDPSMNPFDDAFRAAGLDVSAPPPAAPASAPAAPELPDPLASDWIALHRQLGGEVPRDPSIGQLTQRSDALARSLEANGRKRDAAELRRLKEAWLRERARRAWGLVKDRFEVLALSEKAYRALKQEDADPERILTRLRGPKGEALRGVGAAKLREALS